MLTVDALPRALTLPRQRSHPSHAHDPTVILNVTATTLHGHHNTYTVQPEDAPATTNATSISVAHSQAQAWNDATSNLQASEATYLAAQQVFRDAAALYTQRCGQHLEAAVNAAQAAATRAAHAALNNTPITPPRAITATQNTNPRHITARSVSVNLGKVIQRQQTHEPFPLTTRGFRVSQQTPTSVIVRWSSGGTTSHLWSLHELRRAVHALSARNLHLALLPSADHLYPGHVPFNALIVSGTTPAHDVEGLYATLHPDLLLRAMRVGINTQEALRLARDQQFTEDAIAMLEALSGISPNLCTLLGD